MKRFELYETIEEADEGFKEFCDLHTGCNGCPFKESRIECQIAWLYQEVGLKPCPFCGGEAKLDKDVDKFLVTCKSCGCGTVIVSDEKLAVLFWNKRVEAPALPRKEQDEE